MADEFEENGKLIKASIADASSIDTSFLPKSLRGDLREAFDNADQVQTALAAAFEASEIRPGYRRR